jgi:hypothetical protein
MVVSIWSYVIFAFYYITHINPLAKFATTFSLVIDCIPYNKTLATQLMFYSIGDYLIEIPNYFDYCLIFFSLGNITKLYIHTNNYNQATILALIVYMNITPQLLNYILTHLFIMHYNFCFSYSLFLLSDIIIGLSMYYKVNDTDIVTFPLYWLSNIASILENTVDQKI